MQAWQGRWPEHLTFLWRHVSHLGNEFVSGSQWTMRDFLRASTVVGETHALADRVNGVPDAGAIGDSWRGSKEPFLMIFE